MNILRRNRDLDDRVVETLLSGHTPAARPELAALAELLQEARATTPEAGPNPSERLAAIFDKGVVPVVVPLRTGPVVTAPHRAPTGAAWRVALMGTAAIAAVLIAAEANTLPAPAQTAVANVVEALTPLTLPRPATPPTTPLPPTPSVAPKVVATRAPAPKPQPQHATSPRPSASPRLVGPDVVILPPPSAQPSDQPSTEPSPAPDPSESPAG